MKDSVVLLKGVFEKEDIRLGLEELSEYIKYDYITRIHKRVERKLNLFAIYNKDEDNLLPKIFSVYGNKMHDIEMLYYLSFELLNQNIKWNYSTIDEFKQLILQEYQLYYNDQFYKVITERKNETKSSELFVEDLNEINQMTGFEFEDFLKNVFLKLGYNVVNTKLSGDQGADLIINNKKVSYAVQAKRYKGVVGNTAVQEVIAGKNYYNCDEALVVTSGRFTKSAVELSEKTNVILWDSNKLIAAIKKINTSIKNIEQPLVDEKNKQYYIQDVETIKLEKEKQKLKKEIEALKYNKLKYEKDLLNVYKYIDISKEVNVYIQYLEKKNLVNKLFIEKKIPENKTKFSVQKRLTSHKKKFNLSIENREKEKISGVVKIKNTITQERTIPDLLKHYDEYQNDTEVNQLVKIYIDSNENSGIRSSILSPTGTWKYIKHKYLDELSLLVQEAGIKRELDLKVLEKYLIYEALDFEYMTHSKILESTKLYGLDENEALEKLISNHNLQIPYFERIAYGERTMDQFSVDLLSFHLYRENVITKHKNNSQLIKAFNEIKLKVQQKIMLSKFKSEH